MWKRFERCALLVALGCIGGGACAQSFPAKPIRYIIAFPPGGSNDILARIIGARMTELMGQTVIVDNRPGGGANIGAEAIARSAPDGYTIGNISATHTINATLYPKLSYDVLKDFTPVTRVAEIPLLPRGASGRARQRTERTNCTYAKTQAYLWLVRYRHAGPPRRGDAACLRRKRSRARSLQRRRPCGRRSDGGNIELLFNNMPELVPFVKAGKMRAIGVTSLKRDPVLPDTTTMIEAGFAGFDLGNWVAIVGPAGIPRDVVAKLNTEIVKILREPATREKIAAQGFNIVTSTPDELAAYIRSEHDKWGKLVKVSGAKVE